jgi:hypothetical protein
MAFIAPIIAGFLSEIGVGAAVASTAAAVTGTEAAGAAAGTAVVGAVASNAAGYAQKGAEGLVDSAFGQGTSANAEKTVQQTIADAKDAAEALFSGDYETYMRKKREQKLANRPPENKPAADSCKCETVAQPTQEQNYVKPMDVTKMIIKQNGGSKSFIDSVIQINQQLQQTAPQQDSTHNDESVQINAKADPVDEIPVGRDIPVKKDAESLGHDLGRLISLHTTEQQISGILSGGQNPKSSLDTLGDVTMYNPSLAYLVPKVIQYNESIKDIAPTTDEYKKIAAVYNGKVIITQTVQMRIGADGLKEFGGFDEVGKISYYKENPKGFKLPTIQGIWTGPNSPNNALPINLWDTFSYYHDVDYHNNGWFDLQGDYKYISRLTQNMDRFEPDQLTLIKGTIAYFSTIGQTLSRLKGSLSTKVADEVIPDTTKDDIFPVIMPESQNLEPRDYTEMRKTFYAGIIKGIEEESSRTSVMALPGKTASNSILQSFDRILIQVI